MTRVRFVTAATVLGAFVLFSVVVAAARVGAENPPDAPPDAPPVATKEGAVVPAESVDAKEFRLILSYHGQSDKPFYNLILNVPPTMQREHEFSLAQQISEEQAGRLIKHLKDSQFFEHAKATKTQDDPTTGPQYLLRVRLGESHFEETLGWDFGTITRLDALRKTLDGEPAKLMDQLLSRLNGQRKIWESGAVVNDLKTTLSHEKTTHPFSAGKPIPIKVELTNVGKLDRQYAHHSFVHSGSEIVVTDEHGRQVPYLGGGAGLQQSQVPIKAGETKVIAECDLSAYYYLRRPGRYAVSFRTADLPPSNTLRFQVEPDDAATADGDPIARLLPLASPSFGLVGSPNANGNVRPWRRRKEVPGRQFIFVGPGGMKVANAAVVWVWLTDEAAEETVDEDRPESEYLGTISRWHIYFHASPRALEFWPSVKRDITAALAEGGSKRPHEDDASADKYRLLHDRYRSLILVAARAGKKDDVARLTDKFNELIGGKLLFAQVTLPIGPGGHEPMFTRRFDPQRRVNIGKLGYRISGKPLVIDRKEGFVLIATNPLGENKWPDDLQVTLAIDNAAKEASRKPPAEPKWSEPKNGLRTRISAEKQSFPAGAAIPLKLEIENVGTLLWKYETPVAPHNNTLIVLDEGGHRVPYLAGLSQVRVRLKELAPGTRDEMKAFDLSESFYLRRPGRYSVRWSGGLVLRGDDEAPIERAQSPDTAPFEFDVTENPEAAADGDPIGRLLPLVKEKWWLTGTGKTEKLHPGGNREEVLGCFVYILYNPTGYKPDSGMVSLWLTEEAAAEQPVAAEWPPASEYLGKVDRWHVYAHIDANGGKAWPAAKDDIKKALAAELKHAVSKPALKKPQWGKSQEGFRAYLSATKQVFEAGEPIPVKLEIGNGGEVDKEYSVSVIPANQKLKVLDERGRDVLPLLGLYQVTVGASRPENIRGGRSIEIASFDLGESFYLRRPGRYTVSWSGKPASAELEFEVIPNPARATADGDPIGRLLPLRKEGWWLGAGPKGKFKPGSNWGETTGQIVRFVKNPPAHKGEGLINLWLADEPAAAVPVRIESSIPTSEYLGKLDRWHVYYLASETAWPTAKEDITKALAATPAAESAVSLRIDTDRDVFGSKEEIPFSITLRNGGAEDVDVPKLYFSAGVVLDGKEYVRLPNTGVWRGQGTLRPKGEFHIGSLGPPAPGVVYVQPGPMLSQYGIEKLEIGDHKLALKVGDALSNEVVIRVRDAIPELSLKLSSVRGEYLAGEVIAPGVTVANDGKTDLRAPETFWSVRLVLDGKVYKRRADTPWSGPGIIKPGAALGGSVRLSEPEFGIKPSALAPGEHKLAAKLGSAVSNEVSFTVLEMPKVSLAVECDREEFAAGEDVTVTLRINNLGAADITAPSTFWFVSILLDGKEYKRLPKFIGNWNGPGTIIPDGSYGGAVDLSEYGVKPATLASGEHKLTAKFGDEQSNELAFTVREK
jgi:hypothetical protein